MTREVIAPADRLTLTGQSGSSRKLLQRKAMDKAETGPDADALEDTSQQGQTK